MNLIGSTVHLPRALWLLILVAGCSAETELASVCDAFAALEKEPSLARMADADRLKFVNERVSPKLLPFSRVAPMWKLIPNFESEARYRMFKRGADELVGRWDCAPMERLAPSLSQPVVGSK